MEQVRSHSIMQKAWFVIECQRSQTAHHDLKGIPGDKCDALGIRFGCDASEKERLGHRDVHRLGEQRIVRRSCGGAGTLRTA